MNYIESNKEAWEEAFEHRHPNWGEENYIKLLNEELPFFDEKAGIKNCKFVAGNILDIPEEYHNSFDLVMFTIGAITWFENLEPLFRIAAACLRPGGIMYIQDFHPVMNMLALPGSPEYDEQKIYGVAYSYFRKEPWVENEGMGYMSETYDSKTFISFSHTMAGIINAACKAGLRITGLKEYDYDVGLSEIYDRKGYPLSFILTAEK